MNSIPVEDINYLAQQSSGNINMILSGMTALMNDTDNKVEAMESQGWFKRMVKTVSGKNKLTKDEITKNHDKLNAYMSHAIAELYNRNCIDEKVMMSLGTQLNELYADHIQLKQMLGAFVSKLNEKIDSVDNFHMLTTEINQGIYSFDTPIVSMCKIISQFDKRILDDSRKLDILRRSMVSQNIINDEEIQLRDYLMRVIEIPVDEIGQIYLELATIKDNFIPKVFIKMIEQYHFLTDMERKFKNKDSLIDEVISNEKLDGIIKLSISDIYDDIMNSKLEVNDALLAINNIQVDTRLEEAEKLFLKCKFDEAFDIFKTLAEEGNARAMYFMGEYYIPKYGHIEQSLQEVKRWRSKGSEAGDVLSTLKLAYLLEENSKERDDIFSKTFELVLNLAESGDVFAQNELGNLYRYGYGVKKDKDKCLKWLTKSADAGYWKSLNQLGIIYIDGVLVQQDYSKAIKFYKKAADCGYASSEYNLGGCYRDGTGVNKDISTSIEWYKKAYEHGRYEAALNLGDIYYYTEYRLEDDLKAMEWYKKSYEHGIHEGAYGLGKLYHYSEKFKNIYKAIELYREAYNNGIGEAAYFLGVVYFYTEEVEDNLKAIEWYKKAYEHGVGIAAAEIGRIYYVGYGVSSDKEKAKEWFVKAYNKGYYAIEELCSAFIAKHNDFKYEASKELKEGLGLNSYNKIYLTYNDRFIGSDDVYNTGFAITSEGIFCRPSMSEPTEYVSFTEFSKASYIYIQEKTLFISFFKKSYIYTDSGKCLAYCSEYADEDLKKDLLDLFKLLHKISCKNNN